jgi:hypothetical protein
VFDVSDRKSLAPLCRPSAMAAAILANIGDAVLSPVST